MASKEGKSIKIDEKGGNVCHRLRKDKGKKKKEKQKEKEQKKKKTKEKKIKRPLCVVANCALYQMFAQR